MNRNDQQSSKDILEAALSKAAEKRLRHHKAEESLSFPPVTFSGAVGNVAITATGDIHFPAPGSSRSS